MKHQLHFHFESFVFATVLRSNIMVVSYESYGLLAKLEFLSTNMRITITSAICFGTEVTRYAVWDRFLRRRARKLEGQNVSIIVLHFIYIHIYIYIYLLLLTFHQYQFPQITWIFHLQIFLGKSNLHAQGGV